MKDLKLTSRAEERVGDPPLPPPLRTETVLKRDDWMLLDPTTPPVSEARSSRPVGSNDEDMADGYGEPSQNARTTSGAVDFFASLGTDVVKKKKPEPDRPNPDQVYSGCFHLLLCSAATDDVLSHLSATWSSTPLSRRARAWTTFLTLRPRLSLPAAPVRNGA